MELTMNIWSKYVSFERKWAHMQTPQKFTRLHNYYDSPTYETHLKVWVVVSVAVGVYTGYLINKLQKELEQGEEVTVPQEWVDESKEMAR
jgi:hypothetical protein